MAESDVQVSPSGGGPNVRTLQITTLVAGTPTTVQMQVVNIADLQGNALAFGNLATLEMQQMGIMLLRRIAQACERIAGIPSLESELKNVI